MDLSKLSRDEIEQLYNAGGFFVLNGLPLGSHFAIDGQASVTGPRFQVCKPSAAEHRPASPHSDSGLPQGLKLVPPGFHLITFVPGPKSENSGKASSANHIGQQIQRGLLRFFKPQEIVIKSYDKTEETLHQSEDQEPEVITSRSYMKSLDTGLAPYPIERYSSWKRLTSHIHQGLVDQVFGSSNEVIIDSLMQFREIGPIRIHRLFTGRTTDTICELVISKFFRGQSW